MLANKAIAAVFPGSNNPGTDDIDLEAETVTLTRNQLILLADQCEQALFGGLTEDEAALYRVMDQMRTNGDVVALVNVFGTRCQYFGAFNCGTLPQAIVYWLSPSEISHINDILIRKGITVGF